MTDRAASPADEKNRVRVRIAFHDFRVGDTYCPAAGSIPSLTQRGLVERVKADPPKITRELKSKGRAAGYVTR